jgi:hypothetical protein
MPGLGAGTQVQNVLFVQLISANAIHGNERQSKVADAADEPVQRGLVLDVAANDGLHRIDDLIDDHLHTSEPFLAFRSQSAADAKLKHLAVGWGVS